MPESVRNRCTKSHEYIFLLTKSNKYFCDMEAIKGTTGDGASYTRKSGYKTINRYSEGTTGNCRPKVTEVVFEGRSNKRSVWTVSSQGYDGTHFATFPPKLIEPMIKAGTSERGCCTVCKAPWRRVVEEKRGRTRTGGNVKEGTDDVYGNNKKYREVVTETKTVGWEPICKCGTEEAVPCTVLDPFIGSGTTACVAVALGRRAVGIDLSEKYLLNNAIPRIEGTLLSRPSLGHLVPREAKRVEIGRKAKTVEL